MKYPLCSNCFSDRGLRLTAESMGSNIPGACENCGGKDGKKLSRAKLEDLMTDFFWSGSFFRADFGGASRLVSNPFHYGQREVVFPSWLEDDATLIENALKVEIFHYGPPLWRLGEIEPLIALRRKRSRMRAASDIVVSYPSIKIHPEFAFFRLRMSVSDGQEGEAIQYDSPPDQFLGSNRLDSLGLPVLYGSQNLEICFHECRVTIPDECFVATLRPTTQLNILDMCQEIHENGRTEFESVNLAVHYLFSAGSHCYEITRALAKAACKAGFDGILYPSYFSTLKDNRVANIGIFGRPIAAGTLEIVCVNRAFLKSAAYGYRLGPIFE